jgi:hypothetical protein
MKTWLVFLLVFLFSGCAVSTSSQQDPPSFVENRTDLPDLGEAPELVNEVWLNTPQSLRLAELRGKVVVLDMWTFG